MLKKKRSTLTLVLVVLVVLVAFLIYKFVLHRQIDLKREKTGAINVLMLGRGGGSHDGPNLTDTIILAMVNPEKNEASLVTIPRDLWVPDIKGKINLAYAIGQKDNKQGILLAKAAVEKVTGQNIDYVVVIDFSGFVKVVDYIGGVDVNVARTLDDYNYPIEGKETDTCGHPDQEIKDLTATASALPEQDLWAFFSCRYQHVHVDAGMQHMNGLQALTFSRSRHGVGEEGSDFARSRRQSEVINAVKSKVLSLGIILNPIKVIGVLNILKDDIDTNIKVEEYDDFVNLARKMQTSKLKSFVIDFGNEEQNRPGLLKEALPSADKGFQYNLVPRIGDGNFSELHDYTQCIAEGFTCAVQEKGIAKKLE